MVQALKLSELANRKRKNDPVEDEESEIDISSTDSEAEEVGAEEGEEIVNIDFDFFDGNPDVDFHAVKHLARQLLGPQESNRVQLSALSDLILASPTTTIKTDGKESDPYCFLSIIDYKENKNSDWAKYLNKVDPRIGTFLQTVGTSNKDCALVMSERLINMPPEVVPPLYRITLEDAMKARDNNKPYDFYVIVSRKYEVNFDMDEAEGDASARSKKRVHSRTDVDYFHEEDRFFEKHAKIHFDGEAKKGLVSTYIILDHDSLVKSIDELEQEITTW
ncbi:Protein BCP1 [Nakaseomyces bracarensis]|uniref:Protein BCP1 n=1 Tax=Nakaseomyces bracarensis TaxID=273131 RepID=A0ABR4P0H7_9SACH